MRGSSQKGLAYFLQHLLVDLRNPSHVLHHRLEPLEPALGLHRRRLFEQGRRHAQGLLSRFERGGEVQVGERPAQVEISAGMCAVGDNERYTLGGRGVELLRRSQHAFLEAHLLPVVPQCEYLARLSRNQRLEEGATKTTCSSVQMREGIEQLGREGGLGEGGGDNGRER